MEDDLNYFLKNYDELKINGRRPQKKIKMEDDLNK